MADNHHLEAARHNWLSFAAEIKDEAEMRDPSSSDSIQDDCQCPINRGRM